MNADIAIVGGGPAGSAAALRLLALGHRVVVIEAKSFPRPHIGEALSPGVPALLDFLGAGSVLTPSEYLRGTPARILWETPDPVAAPRPADAIVVDRGRFDADLLASAVREGAGLLQPATVRRFAVEGTGAELTVETPDTTRTIRADVVIDARGRRGASATARWPLAPPLLALWSDAPNSDRPAEALVEATPSGWFWGSPLPGDRFRRLYFTDLHALDDSTPEAVFSEAAAASRLFVSRPRERVDVRVLPVHAWVDAHPLSGSVVRVGESAFTLDPLSSSGVEKALRSGLQAALAVHHRRRSGAWNLAETWYPEQLADTVVTHERWTREHYRAAWPTSDDTFWMRQRAEPAAPPTDASAFVHDIARRLRAAEDGRSSARPTRRSTASIEDLAATPVVLSPETTFCTSICAVEDDLVRREAVRFGPEDRPIAFLGGIALAPLLRAARPGAFLAEWIHVWSASVGHPTALRLARFLIEHGHALPQTPASELTL
ncbi:MAG: tryptophan 7-halogenase [Verrucomicrobiales bacterium]|nr:tryptophan 7-halogenase [Verrucomicrobiales bacterium]